MRNSELIGQLKVGRVAPCASAGWSALVCSALGVARPTKCVLISSLLLVTAAASAEQPLRPVEGIMDNSFLVEEAYNQEKGVVQHIGNAIYGVDRLFDPQTRTLDLTFTQEWPVFSQTHQFSYTVPYGFAWEDGDSVNGVGDVLLNYRYQAYLNEESLTAFAPRFN
ncbi:MAG: hypothetical protein FJ387_31455 [Verrucomicrobia bacterium]|nr:hypothetical protein [Verrucomicrobiota bacterium]